MCEKMFDRAEKGLRRGGFFYQVQGDGFKVVACDKQEQFPIEYRIQTSDRGYDITTRLLLAPAADSEEARSEMRRRVERIRPGLLWGNFLLDEEDGFIYYHYSYTFETLPDDDELSNQIAAARMLLMLYRRTLWPELANQ